MDSGDRRDRFEWREGDLIWDERGQGDQPPPIDENDPAGQRLETAHNQALTERVHTTRLRDGLDSAWQRFLDEYLSAGPHRFHGWDHADDPRNYYGPRFWSEADCVFRMALELERGFPGQLHQEVPVAAWTFADYDPAVDKRQYVDLVVSDLSGFEEDGGSQERFRNHQHSIFIEAKFFPAGCSKTWRHDHERKVADVARDAARLQSHLERSHCTLAAVLVVDDDHLFQDASSQFDWPTEVLRLVASPQR